MAALIVAGAILLQPKAQKFLQKVKDKNAARAEDDNDGDTSRAIRRRKSGMPLAKLFKGKQAPVIETDDVLHTIMLLLAARKLLHQVKQSSQITPETANPDYDCPPDAAGDVLPQYSRNDPVRPSVSRVPSQVAQQDFNMLWKALLCQATVRLELFCIEVLPIAARFAQPAKSTSSGSQGNFETSSSLHLHQPPRQLPASLLPPLDVCLAWAATVTGPGWSQLAVANHPLSVLSHWEFPMSLFASSCTMQNGLPSLEAPEKSQAFWTQTVGTCFEPGPTDTVAEGDILAKGLRVYCPSPTCSFSAYVPFLSANHGRSQSSNDGEENNSDPDTDTNLGGVAPRAGPSRTSKRGLAERKWRRKCQECGQTADLDTLVGRKFLEDVLAWCEASGPFGASHFEGLLVDPETGEGDSTAADVWACQILSPLFSPALSQERQRRIDALRADGTLGSSSGGSGSSSREHMVNSNSLGAAMRNAAMSTFATTPYALGSLCSWSFEKIAQWVAEHTLAVNPMPALAGSLGVGMPNEHPYPDQMGGGFSAGGLDFNAENPYEEESAKPAAVQAREKRERLLSIVDRVLDPYRRLKEDGIPSVHHTAVVDSSDTSNALGGTHKWTNVILGIKGPVKEMLCLTNQVDASLDNGEHPKVAEAICLLYSETLNQMKNNRSRSRTMLKREPLSLTSCKQLFNGTDTPAEVRLGRLAHELRDARSYEHVMRGTLGAIPRGLLDVAR